MKLEHFLTLYTKINSKWIADLNVRLEIIILTDKNIDNMLFDHDLINFLNLSPQAK